MSRELPAVFVVTAHGRQELTASGNEFLLDVLTRHQVPWSGVTIYAVPRSGGPPTLRACLDSRLANLDDVAELLIYFNRNVNPFMFSLSRFKTVESADAAGEATEYFYQRMDNERGAADVVLKKLSPGECRSIVSSQVAATVESHVSAGSTIVVGVSGGGDSNALLHGLTSVRDQGIAVHPMIIKGIPDWDLGVPRAQALCDDYGLTLSVVEEPEVKDLLGMPREGPSLIDAFEREFKGDDFEFVGTLLIRLALARRARELGTSFICTGLNLEDIVCEALFRMSSGLKPAGVPVRSIGDVQLVLPLWLCPKRIIDGCFPRFSRDNYDARYPCVSLGRNLYYSLTYALQSQFPGQLEQFAQGLSELANADPVIYKLDEQLGFHVERAVPLRLRHQFQRLRGLIPS